jgi:hypothetical protein
LKKPHTKNYTRAVASDKPNAETERRVEYQLSRVFCAVKEKLPITIKILHFLYDNVMGKSQNKVQARGTPAGRTRQADMKVVAFFGFYLKITCVDVIINYNPASKNIHYITGEGKCRIK